uniref:Tc1-like transposase DDE domain-containing protein n=1 Tax=Lates calcarifer TaxID=8187 RepID=A0A4W6ESG7_LATCA
MCRVNHWNDITGASAAVIKPNWCPSVPPALSYKVVKKPLINERQRLAQCCWVQAHKNWTARNWKKILGSDESSFQLYPPPDNVRVRRRPGEALSPACTVHGLGCRSAAGVGHLTVCDGTLNSAKYCVIFETHMLPSARALFRRSQNWMFQQDNAPHHTSSTVVESDQRTV